MNAYSEDLREKIVEALERGMGKSQAARTFSVSLSSVKRYAKLAQQGRSLAPKNRPGSKPKLDERSRKLLQADLEEQFQLAARIRDKTSAANEAVIEIRDLRDRLGQRLEATSNAELQRDGRELIEGLSEIEQALYQVKNQSNQDPLNFPIRLNNRLASLSRSVETGDAKPTDGAYEVFEELSRELDEHLSRLEEHMTTSLETVNQRLAAQGLETVERAR